MKLADRNLRIALLNTLVQVLKKELDGERGEHLEVLRGRYDEEGVKSFVVRLPGSDESLGTINLNAPEAGWKVDEAALLEWAVESNPVMVKETVIPAQPEQTYRELWPASRKALLERLKWDKEGEVAVDTKTGEIVPGLEWQKPGRPTQFQVRLTADGKADVLASWAAGELNEISRGALPQIGAGDGPA